MGTDCGLRDETFVLEGLPLAAVLGGGQVLVELLKANGLEDAVLVVLTDRRGGGGEGGGAG